MSAEQKFFVAQYGQDPGEFGPVAGNLVFAVMKAYAAALTAEKDKEIERLTRDEWKN